MSPAIHGDLTLLERCECSLTGFILFDLWKLAADQMADQLKVQKGATFLAPQTMNNLQGTALSTIALCVGKPADWRPWRNGFARLSELPIEHHFGYLRCQVSSAKLTARGFFHADARQSLKHGQDLNKTPKTTAGEEPPLTDHEFLARFGGRYSAPIHFLETGLSRMLQDHFESF